MATLSQELKARLQENPGAMVRLIVRLKDDPAARVADVHALGLTVRHTYTLISAIATEGTAAASLVLAAESWVDSIEEDKQVHTM